MTIVVAAMTPIGGKEGKKLNGEKSVATTTYDCCYNQQCQIKTHWGPDAKDTEGALSCEQSEPNQLGVDGTGGVVSP
ncbi:hypothetical protein SK128_014997 [Halocaridina rubra]|uniref:Uncharacterized protein n=1 Tax=Halocaridina rubra TaxID=373956 RepID=A0AAN8XGJ4_HALRR